MREVCRADEDVDVEWNFDFDFDLRTLGVRNRNSSLFESGSESETELAAVEVVNTLLRGVEMGVSARSMRECMSIPSADASAKERNEGEVSDSGRSCVLIRRSGTPPIVEPDSAFAAFSSQHPSIGTVRAWK